VLSAWARRAARALALLGAGLLLVLALGTVLDVLLRYVFARPIRGFVDVAALGGAVALSACMPHVVAIRGHIGVDALGRRLGGAAQRLLERLGALATALFFALMAWQYARFTLELWHNGETTSVLRWPVWPWWAAVTGFVALTAMVGVTTWRQPPPAALVDGVGG